jgi:hypothetical protein
LWDHRMVSGRTFPPSASRSPKQPAPFGASARRQCLARLGSGLGRVSGTFLLRPPRV